MIKNNFENKINVIYLAGVSYCGSTLLSFILNTHPQIFSIGEMGPYAPFEHEGYKCSCGSKIHECPFIIKIKDIMEKNYNLPFNTGKWNLRHEIALNRITKFLTRSPKSNCFLFLISPFLNIFSINYKELIRLYSFRNEAFIRASLAVSDKKFFFDATKSYRRIILYSKNPNINLKVLHLVRDPRGYAFSAYKRHRKALNIGALEWRKENHFIGNYVNSLKTNQALRLKYENFCVNPQKSLKILTEFIGARSFNIRTDQFGDNEHHIIGNDMRLRPRALKTIRLDEKWRNNLSFSDQKMIFNITSKLAHIYGYNL